ncbi:histidine kinase [[Clostridium] symbiosum]|uniref:sensor histidine kinase n=1 Tax=Clostridium symbiosum TaxID=1512 RepID=UPI001D07D1F7|nr:histidine kinase [[Clostridium] symbiosum]MCB6609286.1 histidine kinase [[Clostridium] symbiosum]MCB6932750.1 histidine kinase [[Clostridium] symbiosum]
MKSVHEEGKFQKNLQKLAARRIALLILVSSLLFLAGQFLASLAANELDAASHLKKLEEVFLRFDMQNREFLLNDRTVSAVEKIISGEEPEAIDEFKNYFRQFDESCDVHNQVMITDKDGDVLFTSFSESQLSSYLVNYNNAVCYNARNCGEGEVYRAVYYDRGDYADALFVKPIFQNGEVSGYITLFLSGSGWNFYLSESNFDGVITDLRQNVMYISKPGLADSSNKFYGTEHGSWMHGHARYWVVSKEIPEYSAVIYSLVYYPRNEAVHIGLLALLVMGAVWYWIARWMAKSMAENNAASIERLVSEIRIIRKGDYDHRIQMNTDDEFNEVGYQVNNMLDSIQALNGRNTELLKLNSRIEMDQLTAQMNPHFLYNTLEIIRNLVAFDADKAEELIVKLTEVLRYSVDTSRKEVTLEEDMRYIDCYLDIQNCRFGSRFNCQIDFTPECFGCIVPKLLLQPLIENSIKYGFQKKMDLNITIRGTMEGNILYISVLDDGLGMEAEKAEELREQLRTHDNSSPSIGLRNLSRRLYLKYGDGSGLQIRNMEGIGFEVLARIEQQKGET